MQSETYGKPDDIAVQIARAISAERDRCAAVCLEASTYFGRGAGSDHSQEARALAQAQCEWLAREIQNPSK